MIQQIVIIGFACLAAATALPSHKTKRQAETYVLPADAELVVGQIRSTFSCQGRTYGYYSDVDNECKIFHVCVPVQHADGREETFIYSFFCGNQTVFDQSMHTCMHQDDPDVLPCSETDNWLYLNDFYGNQEKQWWPRLAIPDRQPQRGVESAPNVIRNKK